MPKEQFQIAVVFNPKYKWEPIAVAPHHALVDHKNADEVLWTLLTTDSNAKIEAITFAPETGDLFDELREVPNTQGKQWVGLKGKKVDGVFKYSISVGGKKLDPTVISGRRP